MCRPGRDAGDERHPHGLARSGSPARVAATTVDSQCGSSQQALNLAYPLISSGVVDTAVACGVEAMSRVPMGSTIPRTLTWASRSPGATASATVDVAVPGRGDDRDAVGHPRQDCDEFGKLSQDHDPGARQRLLRVADPPDRGARAGRRRRAVRDWSTPTRGRVRRRSRASPASSRRSDPRASTPRARRHRSATARRRCSSPLPTAPISSACAAWRASSTPAWPAATPVLMLTGPIRQRALLDAARAVDRRLRRDRDQRGVRRRWCWRWEQETGADPGV